jgi:hypothetical protein
MTVHWPVHAPQIMETDRAEHSIVKAVLSPRRPLKAETLAMAAKALTPVGQRRDFAQLIQWMLDLAVTIDHIKVLEYGRDDTNHTPGRRADSSVPLEESVRVHALISAVVQEIMAQLPDDRRVRTMLSTLAKELEPLRNDDGWFWPRVSQMERQYLNRMFWLSYIRSFDDSTHQTFRDFGARPPGRRSGRLRGSPPRGETARRSDLLLRLRSGYADRPGVGIC